MRRFFAPLWLVPLLLAAGGCTNTVNNIEGYSLTSSLDFTEYAEEGFLITPEGYEGEYQSRGLLRISMQPSAARIEGNPETVNAPEGNYVQDGWMVERLTTEQVVKRLHQQAQDMGADAIVRVDIARKEVSHSVGPTERVFLPQYEVSGFAIKRQ
jgi:hypothetical protein